MRALLLISIALTFSAALPASASADQIKAVCFTPGEDCRSLIVSEINAAQKSIGVHAYSFTCKDIASALTKAHKRKVDVQVVLDKSQKKEKYTSATYLHNAGIPVYIDGQHAIQHNKVIVIDERVVITGSYNFTNSAAVRNAENVIVINDSSIAARYLANWTQCLGHSVRYVK